MSELHDSGIQLSLEYLGQVCMKKLLRVIFLHVKPFHTYQFFHHLPSHGAHLISRIFGGWDITDMCVEDHLLQEAELHSDVTQY